MAYGNPLDRGRLPTDRQRNYAKRLCQYLRVDVGDAEKRFFSYLEPFQPPNRFDYHLFVQDLTERRNAARFGQSP